MGTDVFSPVLTCTSKPQICGPMYLIIVFLLQCSLILWQGISLFFGELYQAKHMSCANKPCANLTFCVPYEPHAWWRPWSPCCCHINTVSCFPLCGYSFSFKLVISQVLSSWCWTDSRYSTVSLSYFCKHEKLFFLPNSQTSSLKKGMFSITKAPIPTTNTRGG